MSRQVLKFKGPVNWEDGPGRAGMTLVGTLLEADGGTTPAQLSLSGLESVPLPSTFDDLTFEALTGQDLVLRSGGQEWPLRVRAWQLHRDVGSMFFAVIRPRPTPWARRLVWSVLLGMAALAPGRWLLTRLSRGK
jgi:hypothetical protein